MRAIRPSFHSNGSYLTCDSAILHIAALAAISYLASAATYIKEGVGVCLSRRCVR